ncbi:hypothetical protein OAM01_00260 [bacterium]|nr:hypothetical protein [bacterium]
MIWLKRIFVGVGILVLLPLLLAVLISRSGSSPQSQALPNGLSLNIEQITYGNQHKFGPPEFPVGVLKQIIPGLPVTRSISHGTQDDSLVVWLSLEDKKQEWMVPMTNLVSVVARDKKGSRFGSHTIMTMDEKHWRYQSGWGGNNQTPPPGSKWFISLITLEQYPRNEPSFELDLLDVHKEVITTLEIQNPAISTPKTWTPESFPIFKQTKAVDIQLISFTNSWRIRRSGRLNNEVPQYLAKWKYAIAGEERNDWNSDSGVIEDTFGNISGIARDHEGNVSMESTAWKLTYDFHKKPTATFPPEHVWNVTIENPGKGKSKALNLSKKMMDVLIELKSITGPKTKVTFKDGIPQSSSLNEDASGSSSSSSSTFNGKNWIYTSTITTGTPLFGMSYAIKQHNYRVTFLVKNVNGEFKPMFMRQQTGMDHLMSIQETIPESSLDLKIIIQPVIQESFLVKPRLDPPVHKFTRAKKIPKRDEFASRELVDLSAFYSQNFQSNLGLNGHIGTSSLGTSFRLGQLTPGIHHFNDIRWDLRGMITLTGQSQFYQYLKYPASITDIPIRQPASKLHFLHGCLWPEKQGTEIGSYKIIFENKHIERIPILYGINVANIVVNNQMPNPDVEFASKVDVYSSRKNKGSSKKQFFYHFEWTNPFPDQQIVALEFESARKMAAPVLLGLTLEPQK